VLSAARAARERGVEVTLLDDSAAAGGAAAVAELLARELATIDSGSVTARLQPAGRSELATIVISPLGGNARMLTVDRDGRVR
jgi:NADPH-dependent 2,4-dienoyl-CoA reductase/sulfur reductase-like enzyme